MIIIIIGLFISLFITYYAYKKNSLSFSGLVAALILGLSLYLFGGIFFVTILLSFFISSSLLSKFKHTEKDVFEDINEKSGGRDYTQVIANGGLGFLYGLLYYLTKNHLFIVAFAAAFAASNSDTWSSEVGVLSKSVPISIINFKPTERGLSGAISLLGTLAAFSGSLFISIVFVICYIIFFNWSNNIIYYSIIICITGFLGSLIDSYMGVLLQAKYTCVVCGKTVEKAYHHGTKAVIKSGVKWINNDVVNFASCALASLIAVIAVSVR